MKSIIVILGVQESFFPKWRCTFKSNVAWKQHKPKSFIYINIGPKILKRSRKWRFVLDDLPQNGKKLAGKSVAKISLSYCEIILYIDSTKKFIFLRILAKPLQDYNLTDGENAKRGPFDAFANFCDYGYNFKKNGKKSKLNRIILTYNRKIRYDGSGVKSE